MSETDFHLYLETLQQFQLSTVFFYTMWVVVLFFWIVGRGIVCLGFCFKSEQLPFLL